MTKLTILRQGCKGADQCGICKFVCPEGLYRDSGQMNDAGYIPPEIFDQDRCTGCGNCMIFCPDMAIIVEKNPNPPKAEKENKE